VHAPSASHAPPPDAAARIAARLGDRSIVLVGMPGAGKTTIGRRLAQVLKLGFVDADAEIERAAAMTIPEIFSTYGEQVFRDGEKRVIARLLDAGPQVIATGGGAFMSEETRAAIRARGISVWIRADVDVLLSRVRRKGNRPLLAADPEATLRRLIALREPVFAQADVGVQSSDVPHEVVVSAIVAAILARLESGAEPETGAVTSKAAT
jgi:shikimate kinase